MVAVGSCCGEWVVSDGAAPRGEGPHDLFGGVGCTTEILIGGGGGAGMVDGDSSERCFSGVVGSLRNLP